MPHSLIISTYQTAQQTMPNYNTEANISMIVEEAEKLYNKWDSCYRYTVTGDNMVVSIPAPS